MTTFDRRGLRSEEFGDLRSGFPVLLLGDMGVDVEGDLNRGVAQPFADDLGMDPRSEGRAFTRPREMEAPTAFP